MSYREPSKDWQESPLRGSSEVRRWRPIVIAPAFQLGVDAEGGWVQFVPRGDYLIPADAKHALFLIPLLDVEYEDFMSQLVQATGFSNEMRTQAQELVQTILSVALRERSPSYIERALSWLKYTAPRDDTREALRDLVRGKRGTQKLRQAASSLLRRT